MLARGSQFLPREDKDAAEILKNSLVEDGCDLKFQAQATQFELIQAETETENPQIKVKIQTDDQNAEEIYNAVLLAVGRLPNVENLGLE